MDHLADYELTDRPFDNLIRWHEDAQANCRNNPDVMFLATASKDAIPSVRPVLYKGIKNNNLMFVGNLLSQKGIELASNPHASLSFWWEDIGKQIRINGSVEALDRTAAAEYFHGRDRGSQIAGRASAQSQEIADRAALQAKFAEVEKKYLDQEIPLGDDWGGWLLTPSSFEFFIYRENRMSDRLHFQLGGNNEWKIRRLQP